MKKITLHSLSLVLFLTVVALPTIAWREGNGGDGIRINSKLYLLDLVEGGVESSPAESLTTFDNDFFKNEVNQWADQQAEALPRAEILSKFGDIYRKNNLFAYVLLMAIEKLEWNWVNAPLKDVADSGSTVVSNPELVQLAVRVNQVVHIQASLWKELDQRNQAALIFHEALFAMVNPDRAANGLSMSSPRVRHIVGFLFSKKLQSSSLDDLLKVEAPEFRFLSLSSSPLALYKYSKSQGEMLFNAHWTLQAQDSQGATMIFNEPALTESDSRSAGHICAFARDNQATLQVGFAATQLKLGLRTIAQGTNEDFYLIHDFAQDASLTSILVDGDLSGDLCIQKINQMKQVLNREMAKRNQDGGVQ